MSIESRNFFAALLLVFAAAVAHADAPAEPFAADIARFVEADRIAMPAPGGVVFVGSSSIRLWPALAQDFPFVHIVQRGFGGSQLADATRYADRIVIPYRPRLVVLYAGDNDIDAGHSAQQVYDDWLAFVARVRRDLPGQRIAFVSIKPSPARATQIDTARAANALIRDHAAKGRGLIFIDVFTPMLGPDGAPDAALFGPDRLHMNAAGYALWRRVIEPVLRREARQAPAGAKAGLYALIGPGALWHHTALSCPQTGACHADFRAFAAGPRRGRPDSRRTPRSFRPA